MTQKRAILALKVTLWLGALAPGAWLVSGISRGWLGANPIEKLTHVTGMTALVLLLLTLTVTPVRRLTGWNPVIRLRRPLGLFAFFYVVVHFSIWFVFDMVFNVTWMLEDIAERKYITVGMAAFLTLIPLAITSTRGWIRRLGRKWAKLHQGVYIAAVLGVVHFYWLVKADTRLPLLLGACLMILLVSRAPRFSGRKKSADDREVEEVV
ncbi:MAG: sulfoxide reductase heme-binding subunit YedZ [Gemmatimonadetes bacterium]|nr:sulfoxide reductase heme-binding subunit YedZ [Gemmatimonadota bacterium]MDA1104577.1 sulfoxide reductase heme-binding subunit YedZ [Gemmatimonadota bacterium]